MYEEVASLDAMLQKLESAKATYVANLEEAHDVVVHSLKTTHDDEVVEQESSHYSPGRINAQSKREDILQTERDPLDCEIFYTNHDLKEFLGTQLLYERLGPNPTGKGFTYVCNGRIMDAIPLEESVLKLLQPLPSLVFDSDDGKLHHTRVHNPGWASKDRVITFNAVWLPSLMAIILGLGTCTTTLCQKMILRTFGK